METNKIHNCDCMEGLKNLPDGSIDCCVTSPPYWGLRDYGTADWVGGKPDCPHRRETKKSDKTITGHKNFDDMMGVGDAIYKSVCPLCGAVRVDRQIGLEETPEQYVEKLVMIFREVKRVLKKEGTLWLNLGDSYASVHTGGHKSANATVGSNKEGIQEIRQSKAQPETYGLKQKDLVGIPWRVAFALQADGWYLRQDIIWHKPNPMPESVTDRCTKSHEYIFLLSKSPKYYFDNEAIKEDAVTEVDTEIRFGGNKYGDNKSSKFQTYSGNVYNPTGKRNKRSVWTVNLKPFKESHFATFPEELITPCILAGCPKEGVVLDPFMGAGTTALVALRNRRNYIGFELNPEYCELIERRLEQNRIGWGQLGISDLFSEER